MKCCVLSGFGTYRQIPVPPADTDRVVCLVKVGRLDDVKVPIENDDTVLAAIFSSNLR